MKSNLKRIGIALLLLSLLLVLTSCGGPEATYKSANNLLAKGKYAEAAEKFASLGSYEDAAYLAIYADACAKGESSDPYVIMDAISIFSDLSGFKDSNMRATYYWGRFCENRGRYFENANAGDGFQFMEQALEYYESVPLFLDCPTRIKALETEIPPLKESAYNSAIKKAEAGNYEAADELFEKLNNYKDTKTRITYYDIREAEDALTYSTDQDAVVAIAKRYSALDDFLDCSNREEAMYTKADKIVADKYAQVAALTAEGKCADASAILSKFGKYGNEKVNNCYVVIAEKYIEQRKWDAAYVTYQSAGWGKDANKAYYAKAETLMAEGKWNEASTAFKQIISYKDANERINEPFYKQAEMLLAEGKWDEASQAFKKAGSYKDAKSRIYEPYYKQAEMLLAANDETGAIASFKKANTYSNATERWQAIYYSQAERYLDAGMWDDASISFKNAGSYRDAKDRITEPYYKQAEALIAEGKWEEAAGAFEKAGNYKDSPERAQASYYQFGEDMLASGNSKSAFSAFQSAGNYEDSLTKAQTVYLEAINPKLRNATVGSIVTFGSYEQNNNVQNKEPIEWIVLAKENDRLLVLSRYCLDSKLYNNTWKPGLTWENCSLRTWLNNDFLNSAFSATEHSLIPTVHVPAETLDYWDAYLFNPGNSTQDKVFIPSIAELFKYVSSEWRKTTPTAYAKEHGASTGTYWLRSPGVNSSRASYYEDWANRINNNDANWDDLGVRPALWIELNP